MPIRLNTAARNVLIAGITEMKIGDVDIYTGPQPSGGADAAETGTKLASFYSVYFGSTSSGQASADNLPQTTTVIASGTAGWGRFVGIPLDGTAGLSSPHNFILSDVNLVEGGAVILTDVIISMPGE